MKLRNKRTGEIVEPLGVSVLNGRAFVKFYDGKGTFKFEAHSLAELNAEWEDYEELEGSALDLMILTLINFIENEPDEDKVNLEDCKQMLEKLKAWKRLKDKGFKFKNNSLDICYHTINFKVDAQFDMTDETSRDLHILFGGEE